MHLHWKNEYNRIKQRHFKGSATITYNGNRNKRLHKNSLNVEVRASFCVAQQAHALDGLLARQSLGF